MSDLFCKLSTKVTPYDDNTRPPSVHEKRVKVWLLRAVFTILGFDSSFEFFWTFLGIQKRFTDIGLRQENVKTIRNAQNAAAPENIGLLV